jgi:hypothetical protein
MKPGFCLPTNAGLIVLGRDGGSRRATLDTGTVQKEGPRQTSSALFLINSGCYIEVGYLAGRAFSATG